MPTLIDRLLGREPVQAAVKAGTGGTGPGVLAWQNDTPITSRSRNPRRLMREAQELYHRDLIIRAAEHRVSAAVAGLEWHLEDEHGDEVDDKAAPDVKAIHDWLEQPQKLLPGRRQMARRSLWQITSRHSGLCGTAFWYQDQRNLQTNAPMVSLYVNPARMYPVENHDGVLQGWKLDADGDGNGGTPLELDEILQFDFEAPDWGHFGIGLVESAWGTVNVAQSIERHEASLFTAGARLAGLISPKVGVTLSDDQWQGVVRDWRNITSDPESAKRLHILRGAVDYVRTGATMQELSVEAIAKMAREDKLALWGVPQSQLPLPAPAGLNSGETKGFDEAVLYQGAVHDRVLIIKETIQFQVLDRIAAAGGPKLQLHVHEPEFDDQMPLYERAQKALDQPLTVNERRDILGRDPLPDVDLMGAPLGTAIWLPSTLTLVAAGPDEDGNLIPQPEPETPAPVPAPDMEEPEMKPGMMPDMPMKARTLLGLRKQVDTTFVPSIKRDVQTALADQAKAIATRVRSRGAALAKKPDSVGIWWDTEREDARLRRAIEGHNVAAGRVVTANIGKLLTKPAGKADTYEDTVDDFIRTRTGERIVLINQTTRDAIGKLIAEGFAGGLGPAQVADTIEAATSFNEARAEMVARTETMFAYNEASLRSFAEFEVTHVEAIDGDKDAECQSRDGKVYPVDEAYGITDHPNGTLDWAPVIKAVIPDDPMVLAMKANTDAVLALAGREQPAPIVNNYVTSPDVNVTPAAVNVYPAEVTVNLPDNKPMRKTLTRNDDGTSTLTEEPA